MSLKSKETVKTKSFRFEVFKFFIFCIIFSLITLPFLIFHGPFNNVKKTTVGTFMSTMRFQFFVKLFLSEDEISKLLVDSYAVDPTKDGEKLETLKFNNTKKEKIELYDLKGDNFIGKVLLISDPLSIKVGYSKDIMKTGERTSIIARRNNAVAAINAGGFLDHKWTGTGGVPLGFIISNGEIVYDENNDDDIKRDTVGFTENGMLIVGTHSINDLKNYNIKEAVSFGPPLIVNGKSTINGGDGGWGIAPRSAIGQKKDGTVIFLTIDGRSVSSIGATLKDVQNVMIQYEAYNAVNLDGGSSTTLYYNNKIVNNPSDALGERSVSTTFMVVPDEVNEN